MKISTHIAYYHYPDKESSNRRYKYVVSMLNDYFNEWEVEQIDIYIHTNTEDAKIILDELISKTHIHVSFIIHDLSNENPHNLTWKHRELMETQKNDYDVFIYVEDDIGIPYKALKYWLEYKDILIMNKYNPGFIRIEINEKKELFCTDILVPCNPIFNINDTIFAWNHQHYCAFWICDKNELLQFINSIYWKKHGYFPNGCTAPENPQWSRESAATGFKLAHRGLLNSPGAVFPISYNNNISDVCFVYHLPNNYIDSGSHLGKFPVSKLLEIRSKNRRI